MGSNQAMSAASLLAELTKRGIKVSASDEQLDIRAPRGALTPELRDQIAQHKAEILSALRRRAQGEHTERLPQIIPDRERLYEPFPLTDIQQAYWVGRSALFDQGDVSIHCYLEIESKGLDPSRLSIAWQRVVAHHDMLRAVILPDGQQQILKDVPAYWIEVLDLRGRPAPQMEETELQAVRERLSHQVFQTEQWPTFEVCVSLLDGDRARIHLSIDLVSIDGGSLMLLLGDLCQSYLEPERPLRRLDISYRDYVLAEAALQQTHLYQRSLDYWRARIKDLHPPPELPLAINPAALTKTRFQRRAAHLKPELWNRLTERAALEGLSPSALLLTAFAEVLSAWSKSPRFTINITLFNRLPFHPQVNDLIGDFTSIVLLGVDCSGAETFVERTRRLQEQLWADLEHRYVSGIHVLRELRGEHGNRQAAMPIVFTSMLSLGGQGYRPPSATLKALGRTVHMLTQTPQVWLDCTSHLEEDGALSFSWDAVDGLFPAGMPDDMFDAYCGLLKRMASQDGFWEERAVRRVDLPEAQRAIRAAVNATDAPVSKEVLPTLLAAQAARQPHQQAVISSRRTLTYDELFRRANQLSHRLARLGCQGRVVAVVMEKGWEQVVAVHGIHSAAAAYLPVDPELPPDRMRYLLSQGAVSVAITQQHLDARLAWPEDVQRLVIDEDAPVDTDATATAPAALPRPEDLAYVLYTSGSTGLPKGVMIEHRSVVNRILDVNERFSVGPGDRAIALTMLHHDLSVYDLFGVIAAGGSVVLPDAASARDPLHWAELMTRSRVTLWNSVPAFMEMLVDALEHEQERPSLEALRLVIMAGDWIPVTLPGRIVGLAPNARIISAGGPTETTVWDICYPIEFVNPAWPSVPYGTPMKNARYYVLNESMEPCPTWVPGQLYIAGAGLARGYFRDEERTRDSFLTHPRTGERIYRSGDMGRYLPDGVIEFLGREDFQVKIQGQRIELGEIEATLAQHPAVRAAAATVAAGAGGGRRLLAYVVTASGGAPSASTASASSDAVGRSTADMITDPIARAEFKVNRHGLRKFAERELEPGSVDLGKPEVGEAVLEQYMLRSTHRTFAEEPILVGQIGELLRCLTSVSAGGLPKHRYASAGGLYPVQVYLYVKPGRVTGLSGGMYYHHPEDHRLIRLSGEARLGREIHGPTNQLIFDSSAFSIFMIGRMAAIRPMYGDAARDFCLLEAGYMGQLLMTEAASCGVGLCPMGAYADPGPVLRSIGQDPEDVLVHSMLGGGISPAQARSLSPHDAPTAQSVAAELTDFLKRKLPSHMVPKIILKDALPLTGNGKVDRKALNQLASDEAQPAAAFVLPTNDVEGAVAQIIQEVLGLERISIHESFFDLGASSRHIVQIIGKLRQSLKVDIRLTDAFKFPTVSALAAHLTDVPGGDSASQQGRARAEARRASRDRTPRR